MRQYGLQSSPFLNTLGTLLLSMSMDRSWIRQSAFNHARRAPCRIEDVAMKSYESSEPMWTGPDWPWLTSASNSKLKTIKKLNLRRQRERSGQILLEGHRLILDALLAGFIPDFVVLHEAALSGTLENDYGHQLKSALEESACQVFRAPKDLVEGLSDTVTPQGVLAVFQQVKIPISSIPSLVLVCDGLSDPGNLGTLLRSAAGVGVNAVLCTRRCTDPFSLKAMRSGMGAQFRVPILQMSSWEDVSKQLTEWGCAVYAADAHGFIEYTEAAWSNPAALVVGSEAHGLSEDVRADSAVSICRIPMSGNSVSGQLESLNSAVAGSIILFEAQRQRLKKNGGATSA